MSMVVKTRMEIGDERGGRCLIYIAKLPGGGGGWGATLREAFGSRRE